MAEKDWRMDVRFVCKKKKTRAFFMPTCIIQPSGYYFGLSQVLYVLLNNQYQRTPFAESGFVSVLNPRRKT